MKKLTLLLTLLFGASVALAVDMGPIDSVYVTPHTGGRAKFSQIDLSKSAAVKNQLTVPNGGTGAATLTLNGMLFGNGTNTINATSAGSQYQLFQAGSSGVPTIGALHLDQSAAITGLLPLTNGGTGQSTKTAAFDALSPNTTKGDVAVHNGTNNVRVGIGSDGQVLTADSTQTAGVKWGPGGGGGGTATNLLSQLNGDFEQGTANWTASGGTFISNATAANLIPPGLKSGSWDSNASGQTLDSSSVTVTSGDGTSSQAITAGCYFKCASGTCTHTVEAFDGTNTVGTAQTITSNTASFTPTYVTVTAPLSGTVRLRVKSVASNEPILYADDCYLGRADGFNLSQISQAQSYGTLTYPATASCQWVSTSASWANFPAQAACPAPVTTGNAVAPATKIPGITFNSLQAGFYKVTVQAPIGTATSAAYIRLSDGTNNSGILYVPSGGDENTVIGAFTYTSPQSNVTFQIQNYQTGGTTTAYSENATIGDNFQISVEYFPSQSQTVLNSNQPFYPTQQVFTSGSGTYTTPAGVKYIRVRMLGGGGGGAGSGTSAGAGQTSGGDTTFGTILTSHGGTAGVWSGNPTSSPGGTGVINSPAFGFPLQGGAGQNSNSASAAYGSVGGMGGASAFGGSGTGTGGGYIGGAGVANTGAGGGGAGVGANTGSQSGGGGGAGAYIDTTLPSPAGSYAYSVGTGGTAGSAGTSGLAGASGGSGIIIVDEYYGLQNAPLLVGSVTSTTTGREHVERANITLNGSTCTVTNQSGTWLTSVSRPSGRRCNFTVAAGEFTDGTYSCTCSPWGSTQGACGIDTGAGVTSTSFQILTDVNLGDNPFSIICMGK